jgi:hypothetical protein
MRARLFRAISTPPFSSLDSWVPRDANFKVGGGFRIAQMTSDDIKMSPRLLELRFRVTEVFLLLCRPLHPSKWPHSKLLWASLSITSLSSLGRLDTPSSTRFTLPIGCNDILYSAAVVPEIADLDALPTDYHL